MRLDVPVNDVVFMAVPKGFQDLSDIMAVEVKKHTIVEDYNNK